MSHHVELRLANDVFSIEGASLVLFGLTLNVQGANLTSRTGARQAIQLLETNSPELTEHSKGFTPIKVANGIGHTELDSDGVMNCVLREMTLKRHAGGAVEEVAFAILKHEFTVEQLRQGLAEIDLSGSRVVRFRVFSGGRHSDERTLTIANDREYGSIEVPMKGSEGVTVMLKPGVYSCHVVGFDKRQVEVSEATALSQIIEFHA